MAPRAIGATSRPGHVSRAALESIGFAETSGEPAEAVVVTTEGVVVFSPSTLTATSRFP
jgi:hypothetical protein